MGWLQSGLISAAIVLHNDYVVVLDGGSSHTTTYVYEWPKEKEHGTGLVRQKSSKKCQAVLGTFKNNPSAAGESLKACLDFAAEQVPQSAWSSTKVLLGATAGVRLIAVEDRDTAAAIIQSVRDYLAANYAFIVDPANIDILTPEREGAYAWTSINYVEGVLRNNALMTVRARNATWGSLDVGGASAQFAMEVPSPEIPSRFSVRSFNQDYELLTWSFLCYGHDEAHRRHRGLLIASQSFRNLTYDACVPMNTEPVAVAHSDIFDHPCSRLDVPAAKKKNVYYITGGGDQTQCRLDIIRLFKMFANQTITECPFQDSECSFQSTKKNLAKVPSGKFLAKGGLFYVTNDLRTVSGNSFNLNPFDANGYHRARLALCAKTIDEIKALLLIHPEMKLSFLLRMCFSSTYNELLLKEIYGFAQDLMGEILFANTVRGNDVGWTFGWGVLASTDPAPASAVASASSSSHLSKAMPYFFCGLTSLSLVFLAGLNRDIVF
ncbi:putative Ectonucleoside triphosphate diphosphohydrolase 1 [Hypsibius exemplaris]|uniref:Ectonucleoside triphosphate diphosphohydrolase 1 n=1 Tax=Hypsibius exemplaris TaxID=2072580 RepID=A0A1W0X3E6_HYPEX|nr:putative Ectonucleoside triphosphate diphosphohydrolase 1 [Hypsibius exemplaris]